MNSYQIINEFIYCRFIDSIANTPEFDTDQLEIKSGILEALLKSVSMEIRKCNLDVNIGYEGIRFDENLSFVLQESEKETQAKQEKPWVRFQNNFKRGAR